MLFGDIAYSFCSVRRFKRERYRAFSLAEVLAALFIGAMIMIAVLRIYSRSERTAAAINRNFDRPRLASEVLQRIAEDLDSIISAGADTVITIPGNKRADGYPTARLEVVKTIYDEKNNKQTIEQIIWQTYPDENGDGLVLYRGHSGIVQEDKLLDEQKEDWEKKLLVPICKGVTSFKVEVPRGDDLLTRWVGNPLPNGLVVTISFAEPFETEDGSYDVEENQKTIRTIAIDRTRKIQYTFRKPDTQKTNVLQNSLQPD